MSEVDKINEICNELPSQYADRLGEAYALNISQEQKKGKGQFFTPLEIAHLMSSFALVNKNHIKILDPGAGTGVLSCALVEYIVQHYNNIESIEVIAYETDIDLIKYTRLVYLFLKKWTNKKEVIFKYKILSDDFILQNTMTLNNNLDEQFDIIITNPPFFKIPKEDHRTKAAYELVSGHANIYALFIGISINLLNNGGQVIFISPRSFASGNYFRAFRAHFFNFVQLKRIHLFDSRTDAFDRDKVLQETVIISAIKEQINGFSNVEISSSNGLNDLEQLNINNLPLNDIVDICSKEKILHLPTNEKEISVLEIIENWNHRLSDFGIQVSTGPVVSFRAEHFITNEYGLGDVKTVPLYWLHNVIKMKINWPKEYKDKGQFVISNKSSQSLLIPNKDYILLRRFSTKDDKSRLIAAPYFNDNKTDLIGIENKLNYIYKTNGHFEESTLIGICALLNSELFDTYFQTFNGNVNVSATEIREMKFPDIDIIKKLGSELIDSQDYSTANINNLVNQILNLENILA